MADSSKPADRDAPAPVPAPMPAPSSVRDDVGGDHDRLYLIELAMRMGGADDVDSVLARADKIKMWLDPAAQAEAERKQRELADAAMKAHIEALAKEEEARHAAQVASAQGAQAVEPAKPGPRT